MHISINMYALPMPMPPSHLSAHPTARGSATYIHTHVYM